MRIFNPYFGKPWWLVALVPLLLVTALSYWRVARRHLIGVRWKTPMALRMIALALMVLVAADFSLVTNFAPVRTVIAVDRSDSMRPLEEQLSSELSVLDGASRTELLLFAGEAERTARDAFQTSELTAQRNALNTQSTDLGMALRRADKLLPDGVRRRVILLTDGLETDGDARKQTAGLLGQGLRIDAVCYTPWNEAHEVELAELNIPRELSLGQTVKATVQVRANAAASVRLALYDDDAQVYDNQVKVNAGESKFSIQVTPARAGVHVYRAELSLEGDTCAENNADSCCVHVAASPRILLLEGVQGEGEALASELADQGYDVEVRPVQDAPINTASYCRFGLVILMNVDAQSMRSNAGETLREYVSKYGRSVLVTGGEHTFAYGHMHESAFEEFLPVTVRVEERESAEPVALLLLIDNSASMGDTATSMHSDFGRPIEMAKLGAIKSISLLNDNDWAGVISFSNKAHVLSPLRRASEREEIIATVSRMGLISGTMYTEALTEAMQQFAAFDGREKKHIILLSDGNPSDDGYMEVARQLGEMGVSISTISVGAEINSDILREIASVTGGRFAQVTSVSDLPNLMSSDTLLQQVEYTVEGKVTPMVSVQSTMFAGLRLPSLNGYVRVCAKNDAETVLVAEKNRPLYIQWHHGTGMAACFASDLSGRWSEEWLQTSDGRAAIHEIITALLPEEQVYTALDVSLLSGGKEALLRLTVDEPDADDSYEAEVRGPELTLEHVHLIKMASGVYERRIPLLGYGRYDLTIRQYNLSGVLIESFETSVMSPRSAEYEAFPGKEEKQLLSTICEMTQGEIYPTLREALMAPLDNLVADVDLSGVLALLAALVFLAEQVLRRIPSRRSMEQR